ncbi:MAG: transcription termination/antitermination protein NusA [Candidatus Nomurabacteria bacterium]|nr:MAG: transcription termination/antitermination protein NusA [Candidatus Nomurabacteria bacterium]
MLDLKVLSSALEQLEEERKIPKEKILEAINQALAAAYKKEYGKKGQIVRANFDTETGEMTFEQVKIVVDESTVRILEEGEEDEVVEGEEGEDVLPRYNEEHHIMLEDAKIIKADASLGDELVFPLETKTDFGRIAAQTAKQVIIQKIREAEKDAVHEEFGEREGEIVSGIVQKIDRGMVILDLGRATGIIPPEEQPNGEHYRRGDRLKAYLYEVEDGPRGINLRLSRTHPRFIERLFEIEVPEITAGTVEIKAIAREAGSRTKMAVYSEDEHIDPVGSCVGQKGIRVSTVMSELGNEKIDIIPWSEDMGRYIANSLSPAKVLDVEINEEEKQAFVEVTGDQLSLAIGKGGQNVRLAAKLTGWKIDIKGADIDEITEEESEVQNEETEEVVEEVVENNEETNEVAEEVTEEEAE